MKMSEGGNTVGVAIAVIYGTCSASMAFINKAVLSSYNYDYPFTLVTVQMVFTIVLLESMRLTGCISIPRFTLERGKSFLIPSVFYAFHCVLSLSALSGMNVPMYGLIKRCNPLVILLLGTIILGKGLPSKPICASVLMVTCGCLIAGYGDLAFDLKAYTYGFASVFSQSLYLIFVQKSGQHLCATESLHLNSYNTFPLLFACWLVGGEYIESIKHFDTEDTGFVVMFVLVVTMGCLLNFLLFLCTVYNCALTTSLTGSLKSIVQTIIGMFTFGGISFNVFTLSGIAMNLSGGVLYTLAKYTENKGKKAVKEEVHANGVVSMSSASNAASKA